MKRSQPRSGFERTFGACDVPLGVPGPLELVTRGPGVTHVRKHTTTLAIGVARGDER